MPFEVAPQELSTAQKLAALIDAGRAAHPNMRHGRGHWTTGENSGCALTFAGVALGIDAKRVSFFTLGEKLGINGYEDPLLDQVICYNDFTDASLEEIAEALRDGSIAEKGQKAHQAYMQRRFAQHAEAVSAFSQYVYVSVADECKLTVSVMGEKATPQPAAKVRKGQGWSAPVAKHAYA